MSLQTDLQAAVDKATADSQTLHDIVHGSAASTVTTEGGPVKTVAKAIVDVEAEIQSNMGAMTANVAATAASEAAAALSEAKANLWAEETEDTEVDPGAFSALHHAAKAGAHQTKAGKWAEDPEDQEVETGKFSARHWAAKALAFAQARAEFHGLTVTPEGNLIWTHGTDGTFTANDFNDWWLAPQAVSISINQQGHMEVTI